MTATIARELAGYLRAKAAVLVENDEPEAALPYAEAARELETQR